LIRTAFSLSALRNKAELTAAPLISAALPLFRKMYSMDDKTHYPDNALEHFVHIIANNYSQLPEKITKQLKKSINVLGLLTIGYNLCYV
jgi:hypothetical protein